ncbi:prepilin peptidase [Lachnospira pectinoschiza]|uniref:prepilin peptidase n=1 Tax=Lachnospira pectinoschiza TaxID=28052 RepID=UPI0038BAAED9
MLTIISVYYDYSSFKIPNFLNLIGFITGTVFVLLGKFFTKEENTINHFIFALAIFFLTYIIYMIGGIGAGDVKLYTNLALLLGPLIFKLFVLSMIFNLIIGAIEVLMKKSITVSSAYGFKLHRIHFSYGILLALIVCLIISL